MRNKKILIVDDDPDVRQGMHVRLKYSGYDTCFFCLGVSALGMAEADYRRTTYDLTLGVAEMLARVGSLKTFIYVSGQGTNADGRQMWARP